MRWSRVSPEAGSRDSLRSPSLPLGHRSTARPRCNQFERITGPVKARTGTRVEQAALMNPNSDRCEVGSRPGRRAGASRGDGCSPVRRTSACPHRRPGRGPRGLQPIIEADRPPPILLRQTFRDDFDAFDPYSAAPGRRTSTITPTGDWRARHPAATREAQLYVDPRYRGYPPAAARASTPSALARRCPGTRRRPARPTRRPISTASATSRACSRPARASSSAHGHFEIRARLPAAPGPGPRSGC